MQISLESFSRVLRYRSLFGQGLVVTVLLSLLTVVLGFILAFVLAMMRLSSVKVLRFISAVYVQIVRCTPMMVQVLIIYYLLTSLISFPRVFIFGFIEVGRFIPAAISLALNSGGYMSDVIRGGIEGIDQGQTEAARSLGMSKRQTMFHIIIPQAIKNILPAFANEFVTIIKESSVCSVIGVAEITKQAQNVQSATFISLEPLFVATFLYFCLCFPTSQIIAYFERRMRASDRR